ncbi:TetR/AcrR family transcriptional regulator [Actinokineospora fastidiosa]|uniref:TetR family transcriptional regulator n=1 Tax=Actinokineospora fastidiosa TaxID=1816 RepID=A0A918GPG3_9PSEU|nr:TetR/AcrR family transcriptional regulator [Actinokineospora fastidiosa]GGS49337.1 TetR family transcriptional regulator [Actinokineospora fastidiosa]
MDGRLARGEQTRRSILRRAADIASVEGLDGLTIGRLATDLALSKSSVFAHFGSKEDLQLAAIAHAEDVFRDLVIRPALKAPDGLPRLTAMCEHWLDYSRSRAFPGGCFFAGVIAEFDAREGRVHDAVRHGREKWIDLLTGLAHKAVTLGHLPPDTDPAQIAFELDALARAGNMEAVLTGSDAAYDRAIRGIRARLGVDPE